MIYEMRTYTLNPGTVPDFEKYFGMAIDERAKFSPLLALWHTEIGRLNQVIHIWPYESLQHRKEARAAALKSGVWPPKSPTNNLVSQESVILSLAPFCEEPQPKETGGIYEMRIYAYKPGSMPEVLKRFGDVMPNRTQISPLAAAFHTELGALNTYIHIWSYADLNERARLRAEASKQDWWPPKTREFLVTQDVQICVPAACSPMR